MLNFLITQHNHFCSGYMAPEYAMRGHLTDKADVYSFGIVALEIVHGRSNKIAISNNNNTLYLIDWVIIFYITNFHRTMKKDSQLSVLVSAGGSFEGAE